MNALAVVLPAGVVLLVAFAYLFRSLASRSGANQSAAEWLDLFSLEDYAPMERLLDEKDFMFLAAQPGFRPEIARKLRAERKKVFLSYLRLLLRDFNQLLAIARLMIVASSEDRSEFARALWRQRIAFYFAVCSVRCRLALHPLGLGTVDVRRLVHSLGQMRAQVQQLAPASA